MGAAIAVGPIGVSAFRQRRRRAPHIAYIWRPAIAATLVRVGGETWEKFEPL